MRRRFEVVEVTLAVGIDTSAVTADDLAHGTLHTEAYEVGEKAAAAIVRARPPAADRRRRDDIRRVLETVWMLPPRPRTGRANIFITPGYAFAATGALITNFRLPR